MALTATASNTLLYHDIRDTGMIDPVIIQVSPVKDNLCYGALEVSFIDNFMPLVQLLKKDYPLTGLLYIVRSCLIVVSCSSCLRVC